MVDTTGINILNLLSGEYRLKAQTNGGEYKGPCPFCGGTKRFMVWPNHPNAPRWWCRECERKGDVIELLIQRDGLSFREACERLNVTPHLNGTYTRKDSSPTAPPPPVNVSQRRDNYPADDPEWQYQAARFTFDAVEALCSSKRAESARNWLAARGITRKQITRYGLGLNMSVYGSQWGTARVYLPVGIVIPWWADGGRSIVRVKVRQSDNLRKEGQPKYIQATGGRSHHLFGRDHLDTSKAVVLVETELDAVLLDPLGERYGFVPLATGSVSEAFTAANIAALASTRHVYLAFDNDGSPGLTASLKWQQALGTKASRLLPTAKDPGEMYERGGWSALNAWLSPAMREKVS